MQRFFSFCFAIVVAVMASAEAKYIFYFIGDGMGANQVMMTEMYLAEIEGRIGRTELAMTQLPVSGNLATFSHSNGITDSSAAGTALASGKKTTNGYLGVNPEEDPVGSIAYQLKQAGYGVGITTSVSIDHATPGAFYAHVPSRGSYYTIGTQLAESGFDFFGGASFLQPVDKENPSAPNLYDLCRSKGYQFARGYAEAQALIDEPKLILIQENEGVDPTKGGSHKLPYAIDKKATDLTLPQITETAIRNLQAHHDRFFLMVEGGAIDWACHGNDAGTIVREVMEFDDAIRVALDFYREHADETLIVVTADHETGGCALGNSDYTLNLRALHYQQVSTDMLSEGLTNLHQHYGKKLTWKLVQAYLSQNFGLYDQVQITDEQDAELRAQYKNMMKNKGGSQKTLYMEISTLAATAREILNTQAKVGWTTFSHSASAVPVYAIGVGAEQFTGWHDNTEAAPMIMKATK